MRTGNLTPRCNSIVKALRFSGGFGQPDGFGSVLEASVCKDGRLVLTLVYKSGIGPDAEHEHMWSVELTNEQRLALAQLAADYQPVLFEEVPAHQT